MYKQRAKEWKRACVGVGLLKQKLATLVKAHFAKGSNNALLIGQQLSCVIFNKLKV
jgi:hypothetical protein